MYKENYDWYFKIAESPGDKNHSGTRQEIIRLKIRNRIKQFSIPMYKALKDSYKTQIRNSIAHSNYSFLGRNIQLYNYSRKDPHAQMKGLDFDNWIDIFHNTMVLYNEYIRMNKLINEHYAQIAFENGNTMEISVTEKDGKTYPLYLEYRPEWKYWKYKQEK